MDQRQQKLLNLVIENYIATAEPVGSRFLVEKGGFNWSEATVRNELRALEEDGYLTHPHTSAGRVPTTKGYEYYLRQLNLGTSSASRKESDLLKAAFQAYNDFEQAMKNVAKKLVEVSDETVLIAFSPEKVYYTGLSNLFEKPDFEKKQEVATISEFYLGDDHPFGNRLSVVASRFGEDNESLIVLLGPQRMNYKKNWSLVHKIIEII
jgi:heat-inducible transcriptional repressor